MSRSRHDVFVLLGDSDFIKTWSTGALTMMMRWMDILVVGVYTQQTTRSPLLVAVMLFARLAPSLVFGVFTGAIAERFNRQSLLACGLTVSALVSVALFVLAVSGRIELWHIGVGALLSGLVWSLEYPTRRTLLGEIAGFERVGTAMSLDSATNHASRMVGPALGGLLLETTGLAGPFLVGVVVYALAANNIFRLRLERMTEHTTSEKMLGIIGGGFRYIRTNRLVAATLAVTVVMNFFGFSYAAMVPVIGEAKFSLGAFEIGLLASMEGIGALTGALVIAFVVTSRWFPRIFTTGSILFLVVVVLFSLSPSYSLSLGLLTIAGVAIAGFSSMQSALIYTATEPALRRRVMGVLVLCIGAGPLGVLHTGLIASWLPADMAIRIIALEGLAVLGVCAWLWPELYRLSMPLSPSAAPRLPG